MTGDTPDYDTEFVNVAGIPFDLLMRLGDSVLGQSVRVLVREADSPQDAVAGHESAI